MTRKEIWESIEIELRRNRVNQPSFPDHIVAQAGVVCGESGDLMNAAIKIKYRGEDPELAKRSAIKTAVAAIRLLENLKDA